MTDTSSASTAKIARAQDPTQEITPASNEAQTEFAQVVERRFARRSFLRGTGVASVGLVLMPGQQNAKAPSFTARDPGQRLQFTPIAPAGGDEVIVPNEYVTDVVIRWGDPLSRHAPDFDVDNQSEAAQTEQFGFNCDYIAQLPLPGWLERELWFRHSPSNLALWWLGGHFHDLSRGASPRALLFVNHEYTTGIDMFPGYDVANPTAEQVDIEIAAHGASVVGAYQGRSGAWSYDPGSRFNRRITGSTPIAFTGPLAGHDLIKTSEDPEGREVLGMFNNCGGGMTPWGTILTCEENFDQYFGNGAALAAADPEKAARYARLAPPAHESERKWERFHTRFDVAEEPNEYARFGYVVEIDPYDPQAQPRKHTALGRFKHEATAVTITRSRRVAVYSGDDARFEYVYKFVSDRRYNRWNRGGNMQLLESGTLYVAKFNDDGTGTWLPLVAGEGPLTAENGFASQAEVCLDTRAAADLVGATKMDRPEDIDVNPVNGKVYVALTNNSARSEVSMDAGEVAANPRLGNRWGHVVEIVEDGDDADSTTFGWEIFLLCGDPTKSEQGTYFAGFDPSQVSAIACPDNLDFDEVGNLWIATDGMPGAPAFEGFNDGVFAVPTEGTDRGFLRQFLSGVTGCEVASLKHSTDGRTLFVTIQHPGSDGGLPNTLSSWPDGTNYPPRPSVVAARRADGQKVGQ